MTTPMPPFLPNAEMAGVGWIRSVPDVDPSKVATSLPDDVRKWSQTGFVTVSVVGGSGNRQAPIREPVLTVSSWAVKPGSEQAPWPMAFIRAEAIHDALFDPDRFPFVVTVPNYFPVLVHSGWPLSEPRKVPGSDAGFAQVQFDVQLAWTAVR